MCAPRRLRVMAEGRCCVQVAALCLVAVHILTFANISVHQCKFQSSNQMTPLAESSEMEVSQIRVNRMVSGWSSEEILPTTIYAVSHLNLNAQS